MTPSDIRKKAEELEIEITNCMNCETKHVYKPGNERCHVEMHLADALLEAEQAGFERGYNAGRDVTGEKLYEDGVRDAAECTTRISVADYHSIEAKALREAEKRILSLLKKDK